MDLRALRHFLAVVESGAITAAAKKLHLSQPALSRQIKSFETDLGVALFERGAHSIKPTPEGELLSKEGPKLIAAADELTKQIQNKANRITIYVGYSPSLCNSFLSQALAKFRTSYPRVRIQLFDTTSNDLRNKVLSGNFDLIITAESEEDSPDIQWNLIKEIRWKLGVCSTHASAHDQKCPVKELNGRPLLMLAKHEYPDYWHLLQTYFASHEVYPKVQGEYDSVSSLFTAIAAGEGIALIAHQFHNAPQQFTELDIEPSPKPIRVSVGHIRARNHREECDEFVRCLQQIEHV